MGSLHNEDGSDWLVLQGCKNAIIWKMAMARLATQDLCGAQHSIARTRKTLILPHPHAVCRRYAGLQRDA